MLPQHYFGGRRRLVSSILIILLCLTTYHVFSSEDIPDTLSQLLGPELRREDLVPQSGPLPAPAEYRAVEDTTQTGDDPEYCINRFSPKYLSDFTNHSIQYCSSGSSHLTCFHATISSEKGRDTFCIGQNAIFNSTRGKFAVDCQVRLPDQTESSRGIIPFHAIKQHWYETGPRTVFQRFVDVGLGTIPPGQPYRNTFKATALSNKYTILVKRESEINIWHHLMEIWSMTMSLDILRMSRVNSGLPAEPIENATGLPFLNIPSDDQIIQVIILDDLPEGPLYNLWSLLTGTQPVRLSAIRKSPEKYQSVAEGLQHPQNIIIPLPGGSNPLWQNDWEDRNCTDSVNLKVLVNRVKTHYMLSPLTEVPSRPKGTLNLLYIHRTGRRKLEGDGSLLKAVEGKYPNVNVSSVDFGLLSVSEQLELVQRTDILVGLHGAALTHIMFMSQGAAVVEIRPPEFHHKGFKNLAQMMGIKYFTGHGELPATHDIGTKPDWQYDDVTIAQDSFLGLIDQAITALLKESRSEEVEGDLI